MFRLQKVKMDANVLGWDAFDWDPVAQDILEMSLSNSSSAATI